MCKYSENGGGSHYNKSTQSIDVEREKVTSDCKQCRAARAAIEGMET